MRRIAILLLAGLLPVGLSAAVVSLDGGLVQARQAELKAGAIVVGATSASWKQLVWYHRGGEDAPLHPQAVVTAQGERYLGRIASYDGTQLGFSADPGPSRPIQLPLDGLAAIAFDPRRPAPLPASLPGLQLVNGRVVNGSLQRLTADQVQLGSALGNFDFPRNQSVAYTWRRAAAATSDQVVLLGGTRLHGRMVIDGSVLRLDHPRLGDLRLPLNAVYEIRRQRAGVRWLSGDQTVHRHQGILGPVPEPQILDPHDPAAGLKLVSDSMVSWTPVVAGRVVMRVRASGGSVGLVVAVDKQTVAKLLLQPGAEELWSFDVPAGDRLLLACRGVDPRPASVELRTPHLVEAR